MSNTINIAMLGLQASLQQLERVGAQLADLTSESNLAEDIIELTAAERAFQANAAVIRTADQLAQQTIDLLIH